MAEFEGIKIGTGELITPVAISLKKEGTPYVWVDNFEDGIRIGTLSGAPVKIKGKTIEEWASHDGNFVVGTNIQIGIPNNFRDIDICIGSAAAYIGDVEFRGGSTQIGQSVENTEVSLQGRIYIGTSSRDIVNIGTWDIKAALRDIYSRLG